MSRSKILAMTAVVFFVFGMVMIGSATAGEKVKWHGVSFVTGWKQIEVGDVEGHVLGVMEEKQLYINDTTGEKMVSTGKNLVDMNIKTGEGTVKGYGVGTFPNGDKITRMYEGKVVGQGHWKGTWSNIKGTGKYEGAKGGGTWNVYEMGQGQPSYIEVEEMPGQ